MNFVIEHSYLIPLLPLIGAAIAGLLGAKKLKGNSHWPIWLGVGASAVMAITLLAGFLGQHPENGVIAYTSHWFDWIVAGDEKTGQFNAAAGAFLDPLSAVMLTVVCGIGFLITVFAKGYMHGESGYFRFFAYLGLFIFAMTILVMGDNLIALYMGWEGVGLCSYLLIGYYYEKPAAREAAKKAFIVNRIGDFGFAVGILLTFYCFGTVSYFGNGAGTGTGFIEKAISVMQAAKPSDLAWWIPFFLMLGAFGKSAQFPLYVWLPDAMEGPTPVSALIHAATMVTAGVYMIVRLGTLFVGNEIAMWTIAIVGAFTAIFAATIALRQNDLKKVFAYSTVSQLGFMFVGVAVLAPVAAIFHLVTHAFFKALLFLSSGVVMHATGGELDMNKMSGMKKHLPKTRILMLIGCLALAGFPLFSGFWSKDEIVHDAGMKSSVLSVVLLVTAVMTAYYTFRLYFRVFEGPEVMPHGPDNHGHGHDNHAHHNHEPVSMILPLVILAIGAIGAGIINLPFALGLHDHTLGHFLRQSPSIVYTTQLVTQVKAKTNEQLTDAELEGLGLEPTKHEVEVQPLLIGGGAAIIGILAAYVLHLQNRKKADELAGKMGPITTVLDGRYWVDEIYQAAIVEPLRAVGKVFWWIDRVVIGMFVLIFSAVPQVVGYAIKSTTQRGYVQGYAVSMLACLVLILLWMFM